MRQKKTRILLYSHDTYGLGHIRRTLGISHQIAADLPKAHQLIICGSNVSGAFAWPERTELVKLPSLSKRSTGEYKARTLPLKLQKMIAWRQQMIMQAVTYFDPDVVLVDKAPAGAQQELLPTLDLLKEAYPDTKVVLGMRDIEDSPERTICQWKRDGVYPLLDELYDHILLYGQRDFFDPVTAYNLSNNVARKMIDVGYLGRSLPTENTTNLPLPHDKPLVLLMVGGGGDGFDIIGDYLDMVTEWGETPFHSLVVSGPLMAQHQQNVLAEYAHPDVTLVPFLPDLMQYMDRAELVISMAGYNSTVELLSLGKRMILIPRNTVREEQRIRAEHLAAHGMATYLPRDEMYPSVIKQHICDALAAPPPHVTLDLNGLQNVSAALQQIIATGKKKAKRPSLPFSQPIRQTKLFPVSDLAFASL